MKWSTTSRFGFILSGVFAFQLATGAAEANSQELEESATEPRAEGSQDSSESVAATPPAMPGPLSPLELDENALRVAGHVSTIKRDVRLFTMEGAVAEARHTSMLPVGQRGQKVPVQTVVVTQGRVDVSVPETGRAGVLLSGPEGITAISTAGRVSMIATDKALVVTALEGDAVVGQQGRFRPLPARRTVRFDRATGEELGESSLPGAPVLRATGRLAQKVGRGGFVRLNAIGGRGRARLRVFDEQGRPVAPSFVADATKEVSLELPRAGTFRVVARALDDHGIEGPLSEPVIVQHVGVDDAGVEQSGGAYLLVPGQRIPLRGAHGLEMYTEASRRFVPAPASVGLSGNAPETVVLRDPSQPWNLTLVRLAPRIATAEVELGPGTAVWPRDPIAMSIQATDERGEPIELGENFHVSVRVNFDEVEVNWTKEGDRLRAELPPRDEAGPWVVRVSVTDRHGREVGRDHLEVIRESGTASRTASYRPAPLQPPKPAPSRMAVRGTTR